MTQNLYRHFDSESVLLYVGVSLSALQRLGQHATNSHWFNSIAKVTIEKFESRKDALQAEKNAIASESPLHNILLKPKRQTKAQAILEQMADESRDQLVKRTVEFGPLYTEETAAEYLAISVRLLRKMIDTNRLSCIDLEGDRGRMERFITGWQLIDFIENIQNSGQLLVLAPAK